MNRRSYRRRIHLTLKQGEKASKAIAKSLYLKFQEWNHSGSADDVLIKLDGALYSSLNVSQEKPETWFYLDDNPHVLSVHRRFSEKEVVSVTIPLGCGDIYYDITDSRELSIQQRFRLPSLKSVDIATSVTAREIAKYLCSQLGIVGNYYANLLRPDVWDFWFYCYESGFCLGFSSPDGGKNIPELGEEFTYKQFPLPSGSPEFTFLSMGDAIKLEDYIAAYLREHLSTRDDLNITLDQGYYYIWPKADWKDSMTAYNLRHRLAEDWSKGGDLYQKIHRYEVWRGVMQFWYDRVYIWFEGYNKDPGIPPVTLHYSYFAEISRDFKKLYDEDIPEFAEHVINYLEGQSLPVGFMKLTPKSNSAYTPPYAYSIIDNDMITEKPQSD